MRLVPESQAARGAVYAVVAIAVLAALWFWVFPWVDRTFVNRPAIETGARSAAAYLGLFLHA